MEIGIERFVALSYFIVGLSHLCRPLAWIRFLQDLHSRGEPGAFANAFIHMPMGILIVAFHNVWSWPQIIVTLIGWALTLKGALYFIIPQVALKSIARFTPNDAWKLRSAGMVSIILGLAIGYISVREMQLRIAA